MNPRATTGVLMLAVLLLALQFGQTINNPARAGSAEGGVQACCFFNGSCLNLTPADCAGANGTPLGPGTSCATANCFPGACCTGPDVCAENVLQQFCADQGGEFQGSGTTCGEVDCQVRPQCPSDVTGDGEVGINDFLQVLIDWGPCP